jgi:diadenosine tetraphosphate (Ap4A) HIT family hydrolase
MMARRPFDLAAYARGVRGGPCFLCAIAAHEPIYDEHHIIYEDESAFVFLSKYPTLYAYTLVAPRAHREQVTGDFTLEEYLGLQRLVYRVGEAIRRVVPCERLYVLSLGSAQGNRHVHWHVAPLPPGVPYAEQQLEALRIDRGVLDLAAPEMAGLAARIRAALG